MNKIAYVTTVFFVGSFQAVSATQPAVELTYPLYSVIAPATLKGFSDAALVPFIEARQNNLPKDKTAYRYGMLFTGEAKSLSATPLLELVDAGTNQPIQSISLDEYFGKDSDTWKFLRDEEGSSSSKIVSIFQGTNGKKSLKFVRTIEVKEDVNLPSGKSLTLSFSIESATEMSVKTTFSGKTIGLVNVKETTFSIASNDASLSLQPALVMSVSPTATIQIGQPKNNVCTVHIVTNEIHVLPKTVTTIMSFTVAGTSVEFQDKIEKQLQNITSYFLSHTTKPELVAVTTVDKQTTTVGDTMMYTIYYHNIGTAGAKEIHLDNAIPAGTDYVENTATGNESTISFIRNGDTKTGKVKTINWLFNSQIMPGDERTASFKVRVF